MKPLLLPPPAKLIPFLILAAAFFVNKESAAQHIQTTERPMDGNAVHINGNIGIGILNPLKKLHIYSLIDGTQTEPSTLRLQNYYELSKRGIDPPPPIVENNSIWDIENAQNNLNFKFGKDDDLQAPETLISFEKTGKIGIGTTLPEAALHIYDPATARLRLQTQWDDGTAPGGSGGSGGSTEVLVPAAWDFRAEGDQLHIDYTQNETLYASKFIFSHEGMLTAGRLQAGNFDSENFLNGQWRSNSNGIHYNAGNMGIGTDNPAYKLHIYSANNSAVYIRSEETNNHWPLVIRTTGTGNGNASGFYSIDDNINLYLRKSDESVGIRLKPNGISEFCGGGINVAGTIQAEEVIITIDEWKDEVFETNYPLMPIRELEQFINTHKHLPDIPSETEIIAKGMETGEIVKQQMQKIEELTLYIIEQNKRIEKLEQALSEIENK